MGRKSEIGVPRERFLRVRVSEAEYEAIQKMQINFAALVRSLARSYTPNVKDLPKAS